MEKVYHPYEAVDEFLGSKWNWIFYDIQGIHVAFLLYFRIEIELKLALLSYLNH